MEASFYEPLVLTRLYLLFHLFILYALYLCQSLALNFQSYKSKKISMDCFYSVHSHPRALHRPTLTCAAATLAIRVSIFLTHCIFCFMASSVLTEIQMSVRLLLEHIFTQYYLLLEIVIPLSHLLQ